MTNVLILGASGELGIHLVKECLARSFRVRALTHSDEGYKRIHQYTNDIWQADASKKLSEIDGITKNIDIVISAMGKSISLFKPGGNSFYENNYKANLQVIRDAAKNGVQRFFYVSMKGADSASEFMIPRTHRMIEKELERSGLSYSVLRPVGFYSGLNDLLVMAKRKIIPLVGKAEAKTNSIYQFDLAQYIVSELMDIPQLIEIGGPLVHTREEMAQMIQERIGGKIIKIPELMAQYGSQLTQWIGQENLGHKLEYFSHIMSTDMVGQKIGRTTYEEYLAQLNLHDIK